MSRTYKEGQPTVWDPFRSPAPKPEVTDSDLLHALEQTDYCERSPYGLRIWTVGSYSIGEAQGRTLREALLKLKELER